ISWGVWNTPESELNVLPDVRGKDVVELGCGTAYVGAWLKRRGARRVVGVDISPAQLATARRMNEKTGLGLELVEANAEATGLPAGSFDLAVSESGFELLDLVEIFAREDSEDHARYSYVTADWARKWPSEEMWRARKR